MSFISIENLSASAGKKKILHNLDLVINPGEVHVIMGPNGSGKSTLLNVIMKNPAYELTSGTIRVKGEEVNDWTADERARAGLFMTFQNSEEIPGITLAEFIRSALYAKTQEKVPFRTFMKDLYRHMDALQMDHSYAERYVNVGFSGGEKKKSEMLQLLMLEPELAMLDEIDSGLDVDAVRVVAKALEGYKSKDRALILVTHHDELIDRIQPNYVHVIHKGRFVAHGGQDLLEKVRQEGYGWIADVENTPAQAAPTQSTPAQSTSTVAASTHPLVQGQAAAMAGYSAAQLQAAREALRVKGAPDPGQEG